MSILGEKEKRIKEIVEDRWMHAGISIILYVIGRRRDLL